MNPAAAAVRVLRPGPRPCVAIGIVLGIAAAVPVAVFAVRAMWTDAASAAGCALLVYGAICVALSRSRIVLTERGIAVREALGGERSLRFEDIVASVPRVLAEPEHPVTLDVYTDHPPAVPALRIRLKPYRREDVRSFLATPALKITASAPGSWR